MRTFPLRALLTTTALSAGLLAASMVTPAIPAHSTPAVPAAPSRTVAAPQVSAIKALLYEPVHINHFQTGVQLVSDDWGTGDEEVNGFPYVGQTDPDRKRAYSWRITPAPGSREGYRIRNLLSRRCMTADTIARTVRIWLRPCDDDAVGQRWGINTTRAPNGTLVIYPVADRSLALAPDTDPWNWPGGDWFVRLDTFGPYLNQLFRITHAPS